MWFRNMANAGDGSNSVSFPASPVAIGYVATQDLFNVVTVGFGDIDGDGVPELVSGWTSGKLEARREANADVVYRDHFSAPLSSLTKVRTTGVWGKVGAAICGCAPAVSLSW